MTSEYLQEQFDKFTATISKLNLYKGEAKDVFEAQDKAIRDFHEQLPPWSLQKEEGRAYFLHFQSPSTGEDLIVSPVKHKLADQLELNALQQLKTYHWLLVEAHEAFVKFVGKAYAHCGLEGMSLWQRPQKWSRDGSDKIDDYNTGDRPYGQLRAFREGSEHFARYETAGPTGRNYKVVFVMMEKLRHVIVHNGGYCDDLKRLIDKMQGELKDLDIRVVREYAALHFFPHKGSGLVDLFESQMLDENGAKTGYYQDVLLGFFRMVVEYAQLIVESINLHQQLDRAANDSCE